MYEMSVCPNNTVICEISHKPIRVEILQVTQEEHNTVNFLPPKYSLHLHRLLHFDILIASFQEEHMSENRQHEDIIRRSFSHVARIISG